MLDDAKTPVMIGHNGGPNLEETLAPLVLRGKTVCRILEIGPTKLHELANNGALTRIKIGRGTRYSLESVKRVANEGAV